LKHFKDNDDDSSVAGVERGLERDDELGNHWQYLACVQYRYESRMLDMHLARVQ
jgi:hypothetical protein